MKTLIPLLLWASLAWSATTTQLVMPRYVGVNLVAASGVANELRCARVVAPFSISGATHLTGGILQAVGSSTAGFGVYPDGNASTALCTISGSSAAVGKITGTCSSYTITAFTIYRICMCSTATGVKALTTYDAATAGADDLAGYTNVFTAHVGTAANACSAGVPPSTTGAITNAAISPPILVIE